MLHPRRRLKKLPQQDSMDKPARKARSYSNRGLMWAGVALAGVLVLVGAVFVAGSYAPTAHAPAATTPAAPAGTR
jgi:hypothetical protein